MRAEIIAVGSELLTPERLDTNSLFLTAQLNSIGIRVTRKSIVGDDAEEIYSSFRDALARADVIISSGGLGPTDDDRTRDTVSQLLGRRLQMNDDLLERLMERFRRSGRSMPEINKRQAMVPEGAIILPNPRGTAPGLWMEANGRIVILLPGVPPELRAIFETELKPRLVRIAPSERLFSRDLRINGLPESEVEARVRPLYGLYPDVEVTILAAPTGIQLHPRIWSSDAVKAEAILDEIADRMALVLGDSLFSRRGEKMEEIVGHLLAENRATIAVAESCTGGMLAEYLTSIPGSSNYFLGGVVCYSNEMKTSLAGVPAEMIEAKGAVSPEVAQALAEGVRHRVGATIGVGVTGIAGPGGGTPEKPVGLVHIGLAAETGSCERKFRLPGGDRERTRQLAAQSALDMVRRHLLYPVHLGPRPLDSARF